MREPRIKASISLRRDQFIALREQADEERHGNVSLIVQRAVDRELGRVSNHDATQPVTEPITAPEPVEAAA